MVVALPRERNMNPPYWNKGSVHLWAPGAFEPRGGIATYSRHLARALVTVVGPERLQMHVQHDRSLGYVRELDGARHLGTGRIPARFRAAAFAASVSKAAITLRPKLIIATHLQYGRLARWLSDRLDIPYWLVAHGVEAWEATNPLLQDYSVRAGIRQASRILPVSAFTRSILIKEQNLDPSNVHVLNNTFEPSKYSVGPKPAYLLERYRIKPDQPVVLTVSRLIASKQSAAGYFKGYDPVIRAFPDIIREVPDAHYILVGKGDDRERLELMIAELGLTDNVTLTGFVPSDELADHYRLCDVFALPSKREGFGIVFLEAMACGKPCLGGNRDAAVDALLGGELGHLVDPDDKLAVANGLIGMLTGTCLNELMSTPEELRRRVINTFGFERFRENVRAQLASFPGQHQG